MHLAGMETKFAKVLDSGMQGDVDVKRKRTDNGESNFGAAGISVPLHCALNFSPPHLIKRQKLEGKRIKCSSSINLEKSLQRSYSNFKNSRPPQRIMYSQNGVWADFPQNVVELVKQEMKKPNAIMEVNVENDRFLLDFLHMIRMHLRTGVQQRIAWVDEAGICYFPEIFSDANFDDCSHYENGAHNGHLVTEQGSNEFTMKLEIEISGSDIFNMKESIGESNAIAAHVRVSNNSAGERFDAEDDLSCVRDNGHDLGDSEESNRFVEDVPKNIIPKEGHLNADAVKELFSKGIGSFVGADIVTLDCGSGALIEGRRELFQKQVDVVKRLRGDANIQYAWLPSPKGAIYSMMNYGLGCHMSSNILSTYGIGAHLIPVSCTNISSNLFDVDENGVGNVVLCRVIMGKMEHVRPESKQFHPSSDDFDSGVDDCQNPKQYVVWSMNMNTHIYPEYAVCFKISSAAKVGSLYGNGKDVSGVTSCSQVLQAQVQLDYLSCEVGGSCHQVSTKDTQGKSSSHLTSRPVRLPKSPWMPFPVLLAAVSSNVSEKDMQHINRHYRLYQNKMLTRGEFITKLRLTVGDTLLKSTLTSLQNKMPSKYQAGLVTPRPEEAE